MPINLFFSALLAYLLGNFSSAYIYVRYVLHQDIRELGSGNAGATNVNRVLGFQAAFQVFFLDAFKGVIAVLVGGWLAGINGAMLAGLAVVAGHDWPAVLNFRGGKGMATTIGVMLIMFPKVVIPILILFVSVVVITRFVSLGSVAVCLAAAPAVLALNGPSMLVMLFTALGLMGIFQHRANIIRLLQGTETRLVLTHRVR